MADAAGDGITLPSASEDLSAGEDTGDAPAHGRDGGPPPDGDTASARRPGLDRAAFWLFVAFVVAAGPLILFHFGSYHWFLRDDFVFLADRDGFPDLLEPNGGAHWSAVPRLIYLVLWQGFGLTTYRPYQACVVALHLAVVVLLRGVMRRAGVSPWLATAAAAVMVLFGPGAQNIVWAFQVGFTGSLAYGLAHLLLADHEGPVSRRDALGLAFGTLAVMSSGVGITTVAVVGLAMVIRGRWWAAALHTVPLVVLVGAWAAVADPRTSSNAGRPSVGDLVGWVRATEVGVYRGMGHFSVVAVLLVGVLVIGTALAWGPWRGADLTVARARLAAPTALFVGGLLFAATTGVGRWTAGEDAARSGRYVYLGAAFSLPLLAVAAQAIARRWRPLGPALVVLFLLPIPFNLGSFDEGVFNEGYMDQRRRILTTAVRMPFATSVPPDVQPVPDPFASDAVTIGFLLTAESNGDLTPSSEPITGRTRNEFKVRLGVAARPADRFPTSCDVVQGDLELSPEVGDVFVLGSPVRISTRRGHRPSGPSVDFSTDRSSNKLTIELPDLDLLVRPSRGATALTICPGG